MKTANRLLPIFSAVISISFVAHYLIIRMSYFTLELPILALTYGFNIAITVGILLFFRRAVKRDQKQLGFAFMYSSFAKFLIFFLVVAPFIGLKGTLKSEGFAAFFIPYAICVVFEVLFTVKMLNSSK